MTCTVMPFEGGVAIVCTRGPQARARACAFCGQKVLPYKLCDFPLRGKRAGATCSKPMCDKCSTAIGEDRDLCPPHAKIARDHGLDPALLTPAQGNEGKSVALDQLEQNGAPVTIKALRETMSRPKFRLRRTPKAVVSAAGDWEEFWVERAAIGEYLGELSREAAEQQARELAGERPK